MSPDQVHADAPENRPLEPNLLERSLLDDPFTYIDGLHKDQRAVFVPSLGAWLVAGHADCMQVLGDPVSFSSEPFDAPGLMANFASEYVPIYTQAGVPPPIPTLVTTDSSVHRRYRGAVDRSFNAGSVRAMDGEIRTLVDHLIDQFIDDGRVDLYSAFCMTLPLYLICDIIGMPRDQAPLLRRSANAQARLAGGAAETPEDRVALHRDQAEFHAYLMPLIAARRADPDEKLLSRLIHTPTDDGTLLSDAELCSIVSTLNVGGNETTTNGLGSMFWRCVTDPAQQDALRADRKTIDRFIEETLRLETPVAAMPRWVYRDAMIGDVAVPAGSAILVSFQGANRDPAAYGCPAHIDTARTGIRNHLAFGKGPHFCLGAMLSRAELNIALNRVLDRMDNIRLDPAAGPVVHQRKITVRGLSALPILFDRA